MTKYFRITFLFLILAEIFSFCGFLYPFFNKICFFAILFIVLIFSLENSENGIYIIFAELFVGSFGYLFFYEFMSLRIGLFLIVMSVFLAKMVSKENRHKAIKAFKENKFIKYYLFLFVFLLWGVLWGIIRNNGLENVFFDSNAYIYFGLIFPVTSTITNFRQIKNIFSIMFAAAIVVSIKTLLLLYVFSHKMQYIMVFLYKWVRDYRFAEITAMPQGFYRIFSQTHLYVMIVLFFTAIIILRGKGNEIKDNESPLKKGSIGEKFFFWSMINEYNLKAFFLFIIFLSVIAIDLSRSFWVGGFAATVAMYFVLIFKKLPWKRLCVFSLLLIIGVAGAIGLAALTVKFPYPKETVDFSADLLGERAIAISGEQGASSRWKLLPQLARATTKHLFIGSGFGSTVTYESSDPRIIASNSNGEYTTYAFEWGYLDIILKIGLLGLFAYLFLIWEIGKAGWRILLKSHDDKNDIVLFIIGLLLGIIVILATSVFSPYMNHPLGIGYIILCSVAISIINTGEEIKKGRERE